MRLVWDDQLKEKRLRALARLAAKSVLNWAWNGRCNVDLCRSARSHFNIQYVSNNTLHRFSFGSRVSCGVSHSNSVGGRLNDFSVFYFLDGKCFIFSIVREPRFLTGAYLKCRVFDKLTRSWNLCKTVGSRGNSLRSNSILHSLIVRFIDIRQACLHLSSQKGEW